MRGHEALIEMRRNRIKPSMVFIFDDDYLPNWHVVGDYPEISVPEERPDRLDLRFLIGLSVHISASTKKRAQDLFDACEKAGAAIVVAGFHNTYRDCWFRIFDRTAGFDRTVENE